MKAKQLIATGLIVGLVAITGCAHNLPETNQGNRNGQRVADAVNHRPDSYRTTSNRLPITENNNTVNKTRVTKNRNTNHRTVVPSTNPTRRVNTPTTAPTTPNRSLNLGRPQGRIGTEFRTNHNTSTSVAPVAPITREIATNNAITNTATPAPVKTEIKKVDTKRTNAPAAATPAKPKATTRPSTPAAVPAPVSPTITATPSTAPTTTVRQAAPTAPTRNKGARNPKLEEQIREMHAGRSNAVTNSTRQVRNENGINRVNRASHSARRNKVKANRAEMNNTNRATTTRTGAIDINGNPTRGRVELLDQTVQVVNNEDLAFFRKKAEEPTTTPVPSQENNQQTPTGTNPISSYDDTHDNTNIDNNINTTPDNNTPNTTTPNTITPSTRQQRLMK